jgi:hypothetical protein
MLWIVHGKGRFGIKISGFSSKLYLCFLLLHFRHRSISCTAMIAPLIPVLCYRITPSVCKNFEVLPQIRPPLCFVITGFRTGVMVVWHSILNSVPSVHVQKISRIFLNLVLGPSFLCFFFFLSF